MNQMPSFPNNVPEDTQQALFEKEREFHKKKWEELAIAQKSMFRFKEKLPMDVMLEEANRDDADFEKRRSEEFEAWQKNLKKVIANFKERALHPEGKEIRTLVVILGGGMKCAYSAGQVMALNDMGLTADKVDAVVGASGGAVVATAYVGGKEQTQRTAEMMAGPMSSKDFIDFNVSRIREGTVINLEKLGDTMNDVNGQYSLDEAAIRGASTELSYAVTLPAVGDAGPEVVFLDAKDTQEVPSMVEGIQASMSLHPRLTGSAGTINGTKYHDGAIVPLPIEAIIKKFKPTDVLILPQLPYEYLADIKPSAGEHVASKILKLMGVDTLAKGLASRKELRESLELIQKLEGVNIGVQWPPDSGLGTFTTDSNEFKAATIGSYRDTLEQWGADKPTEVPFI